MNEDLPSAGRDRDDTVSIGASGKESLIETIGATVRPRLVSNLLLWLILGFFVIFLIWAGLTELDRTVRGQGRIIPSSQMQIVSNLEGGIIEAILVNVGDEVRAGDPLLRLDQTQTGAELGSNSAQLAALNIKIARLQAEIRGQTPAFPPTSDVATAEQVTIERALYASRMADLASLLAGARARLNQARRAVAEAQANYAARTAARTAARNEVDLLRPLVERGIEPRLSLSQAQSRHAIASSEVAAASATVSRTRAGVAEAEAALARARQEWRARAADELASIQAQRASLRRAIPALADRVSRTIVRAPLAGRVNRVLPATVGGTVRAGDPLVEIVPSDEGLIVEAAIRPSDIGQVRIDQQAQVNVTAYQSVVYGNLDGRVVTISPDTTVDERTGEPFYSVRIVTEGDLLDRNGQPVTIGPGMTVDVSLLGDRQSILDYILTPITRLSRSALRE